MIDIVKKKLKLKEIIDNNFNEPFKHRIWPIIDPCYKSLIKVKKGFTRTSGMEKFSYFLACRFYRNPQVDFNMTCDKGLKKV